MRARVAHPSPAPLFPRHPLAEILATPLVIRVRSTYNLMVVASKVIFVPLQYCRYGDLQNYDTCSLYIHIILHYTHVTCMYMHAGIQNNIHLQCMYMYFVHFAMSHAQLHNGMGNCTHGTYNVHVMHVHRVVARGGSWEYP